jgi:hypothetical protein
MPESREDTMLQLAFSRMKQEPLLFCCCCLVKFDASAGADVAEKFEK